ncbi:replication protein A 30 kDa subunit [Heterocephalus glaber]|uniref:Replication protein A 30 kDa subunit n=1 Tax=Heterocephalus glaber TaxID=10181 RepID=A0AAX6QNV4_HETGA|nr:replication protein A 30 kDa subunit [Heterocephalus glaber]
MKKSEFGSYGKISASDEASGRSNNQLPKGGTSTVTKIARPRSRIQIITPCCISQLLTSTLVDNVFKIRGFEVSQISIVRIIRQAERAPNYILYKIDDMTSKPIEACQRLGRDKAKQGMTPLPVGVYAKVFGVLTSSTGAKSLEVLKIRVLEDMNEFTTHILEVVNSHMMLDRAHQESTEESMPVAPSEMDNTAGVHDQCQFKFFLKEVLRLIQECPLLEGKSVHELQTEICTSVKDIKQAIDHLTIEGHIYSTVDEEHFKFAG